MEKNEVLEELKALDSPLAKLPRTMPYAVPKGYFESLSDGMLLAAKGGDVPARYFQNLPQAMLVAAKAAGASTHPSKPKARIMALPVRHWAAAAVLLLSFGIGGALFLNPRIATPENAIATLPADAVQEYVATNLDESELLVSSAVAADALPDLSALSEEELEAYLSEEGVLF